MPTGRPPGRPPIPYDGPPGEKLCTKCGKYKTMDFFRRHIGNGKGKLHPWCRPCRTSHDKLYLDRNPQAKAKKSIRMNARRLGVDRNEVTAYWESHSGACDICGGPPTAGHTRLDIEHDHETNEFRGMTCGDCNNIMKFARDDTDRLSKVIGYLQNPPARSYRSVLF